MGTAIAILFGSVAIAAAILVGLHWEITQPSDGGFIRLNRWTGQTSICGPDPAPGAKSFIGMNFKCTP
jgi:hypothetical protein